MPGEITTWLVTTRRSLSLPPHRLFLEGMFLVEDPIGQDLRSEMQDELIPSSLMLSMVDLFLGLSSPEIFCVK